MIEIIKDKENWDRLVKNCDFSDFYHTYDYHHASRIEGEQPILIHYSEEGLILEYLKKSCSNFFEKKMWYLFFQG
ncbi:hypothetical protein [uncultured Eudoraea sp.]|uniref:hypothetical protein n=1 Tax=uncultured Eudoraea sp. TaxID=1035614 RepID=UPI00260FEC9D|nr:hypothetical protein [uncultured Eudoraea sp.]